MSNKDNIMQRSIKAAFKLCIDVCKYCIRLLFELIKQILILIGKMILFLSKWTIEKVKNIISNF